MKIITAPKVFFFFAVSSLMALEDFLISSVFVTARAEEFCSTLLQ